MKKPDMSMSIVKRVALLIAAAFLFTILDVIFAIICMFIHSKLWLGRVDIEAYQTAAVLIWPMLLGGLVSGAGLCWVWKRSGEDRASPLRQSDTEPAP
ncbi:hypothetical protein [Tardiphaga sp. 862_B3_N1_1]|uniref:hypothetical protein n=1 Tax=Tardiphaga sp. 862_B3_N1_1 TaxID=3240763 RepID=UPI003F8AD034